jgi:hypothetical protein
MEPIDKALAWIESREPGEKIVYSHIADRFGVDCSRLSRRHRGKTTSQTQHHQNQQLLTPAQEDTLLRHIDTLHKRGLPPIRSIIRNLAFEIISKLVGKNWVDRFLRRHLDDVLKKYSQGMDNNRK